MNNNISVSIIVPVYNVENYLEKCLQSVVNQTLKNIEIILVNDGSTDNSFDICKKFSDSDRRIKLLNQKNQGLAAARQSGLVIASGKYIGFVDSDDWLELDMFEKMYNIAESKKVDVVFCNVFRDEDKKESPYLKTGYYDRKKMEQVIFPRLLASFDNGGHENTIRWCNWLRLYKHEVIIKNNISFDSRFRRCQDLPFTFLATIFSDSYYYMGDDYLYHNRMNFESLSKGYTKNMWGLIKPLNDYLWKKVNTYTNYDFKSQMIIRSVLFAFESADNETKPNNKNPINIRLKNISMIMKDKEVKKWIKEIDVSKMSRLYRLYLISFRIKSPLLFYLISSKRYSLRKAMYKKQNKTSRLNCLVKIAQ